MDYRTKLLTDGYNMKKRKVFQDKDFREVASIQTVRGTAYNARIVDALALAHDDYDVVFYINQSHPELMNVLESLGRFPFISTGQLDICILADVEQGE